MIYYYDLNNFLKRPYGSEYIRDIKMVLENLGIEQPLKRDGKVFEDDDCLKETIEFIKDQNANKNKVKINISGDKDKDSSYELGEEIGSKISENVKKEIARYKSKIPKESNVIAEDIDRKAVKAIEILENQVTKEMAKRIYDKISGNEFSASQILENAVIKDLEKLEKINVEREEKSLIEAAKMIGKKVDTVKESSFIPKEINRNFPLKSDNMKSLERVIDTINRKDKQYFKDPIQVLSTDDLLTQIKIKAIRAKLTFDDEKRMDELLDIAVYSILTLEKMLMEPVNDYNGMENYK